MSNTDRESLIGKIHEALGGNGWAYMNYGGNELQDCRDRLERVADLLTAATERAESDADEFRFQRDAFLEAKADIQKVLNPDEPLDVLPAVIVLKNEISTSRAQLAQAQKEIERLQAKLDDWSVQITGEHGQWWKERDSLRQNLSKAERDKAALREGLKLTWPLLADRAIGLHPAQHDVRALNAWYEKHGALAPRESQEIALGGHVSAATVPSDGEAENAREEDGSEPIKDSRGEVLGFTRPTWLIDLERLRADLSPECARRLGELEALHRVVSTGQGEANIPDGLQEKMHEVISGYIVCNWNGRWRLIVSRESPKTGKIRRAQDILTAIDGVGAEFLAARTPKEAKP